MQHHRQSQIPGLALPDSPEYNHREGNVQRHGNRAFSQPQQQVGGPKAGNGGDLCLYLVQLHAGQPLGYGFNAATVDKLRNRNIIDGGEPQNQDCLDPAVADAIGYGVPPVGIALEQKAKRKIAPDFLKHARQQAADQGVSPRMGQHILRNAGAAKENGLGHTFQYLGENNEGHRRIQPDTVINCAAFTNVDGCETNRDAAYRVNALGPRNLALACEKINARLIHISTDYVFSGTANGGVALDESALPAPISAYGQTKLLGETYVQQFCRRHFIVRTAWLYSYYGKNFVKTMVNLAKTHDTLNVVNDQLGNPTNAVDLAYHILKLAVSHDYGIYHCTGSGICSWYDFASEIIRLSGLPCTVKPVTSAQYKEMNPKSADRPAWSALENRALRCSVGDDMRDWKDAIQDFFNNWDGK